MIKDSNWKIGRQGRAWKSGEALGRFSMAPEKIEMVAGKLFDTDEQRLSMPALLLENLGVDVAVRLGDPRVWRDAVAALR